MHQVDGSILTALTPTGLGFPAQVLCEQSKQVLTEPHVPRSSQLLRGCLHAVLDGSEEQRVVFRTIQNDALEDSCPMLEVAMIWDLWSNCVKFSGFNVSKQSKLYYLVKPWLPRDFPFIPSSDP